MFKFYNFLIIQTIKYQTTLHMSILFLLVILGVIYNGVFAGEIDNTLKEQLNEPYNTRLQVLEDGSTVPRISDGYGYQYAVLPDGTLLPLGKEIPVKEINPITDATDGNAWADDTSSTSDSESEEQTDDESNSDSKSKSSSAATESSDVPNEMSIMTKTVMEFNNLLSDEPEDQMIQAAIKFVNDIIPADVLAKTSADITNPNAPFTVWYDNYFKENQHTPFPNIYIPAMFTLQAAMCTANLIHGMGLAVDDPITAFSFQNTLEYLIQQAEAE